MNHGEDGRESLVQVSAGEVTLEGNLTIAKNPRGIVLFAHGSGSSRYSPRNRFVASQLQGSGLATLLIDLLSAKEEEVDIQTRHLRFNIDLLADRLVRATRWLKDDPRTQGLQIGYFGASTGGGAALVAAAKLPTAVGAVVSRGGRPDLAGPAALPRVEAPTLLIVGGDDHQVIEMNRDAMAQMRTEVKLEIIPGATHLFEEPGKLEAVSDLARDWFLKHLAK